MIFVRFDRGGITRLRITGHAMAAPHGQDIVCAAVSVLSITTANAIEKLAGLQPPRYTVRAREGDFSLQLRTDQLTQKERRTAFLLLESFILGIRSLEEEYPEFITYYEGGAKHVTNESAIVRQQKRRRKLPKRTRFRSEASRREADGRTGSPGR